MPPTKDCTDHLLTPPNMWPDYTQLKRECKGSLIPGWVGDSRRGRRVDNPAKRSGSSGRSRRDGRSRSGARCPRPTHGRGPPVTRAAVGRRWATRATNHGVRCPGTERRSDQVNGAMFRLGGMSAEAGKRVPGVRPAHRLPGATLSIASNTPFSVAIDKGALRTASATSTRVVCVSSPVRSVYPGIGARDGGFAGCRDRRVDGLRCRSCLRAGPPGAVGAEPLDRSGTR